MRRALPALVLYTIVAAGGCFQVAGYDEFRFIEPFTRRVSGSTVDKVDLLLVVDESRATADKQAVLTNTLNLFLGRLLNPSCVDAGGTRLQDALQPSDPADPCPDGSQREFESVPDIHIGVITTSLGGHGADVCSMPGENRKAHLVSDGAQTYQDLGFLAWDPGQQKQPPGEFQQDELKAELTTILEGLGQAGCGYEAPLEAWYRFLIEPQPHDEVVLVGGNAELQGVDEVLLAQRAAFLRDDSLLSIVMLSDENDCSIRDGGQSYVVAQVYQSGTTSPYHLPKPRAACATDPQSECCRSCGQPPGPGCDDSQDDCGGALSQQDDSLNLRCFDQKRRFGIDFLWPVERYIAGLTAARISDAEGNVIDNPLLRARDPGLVVLSGIVGVPWHDIARRSDDGTPDLNAGLDAGGEPVGGFMNAAELVDKGVWEVILGDPTNYVDPTDPLMVESIGMRSGTNPVTGDALQPPLSATPNPINGTEYSIACADKMAPCNDDLQYACVFPLSEPIDCSDPNQQNSCDCGDPANDNPLCADNQGMGRTLQVASKAYPGLRQLSVLKGIGSQAVVGSACWAQATNPLLDDYGYYPAIFRGIIDRLRPSLRGQLCIDDEIVVSEGSARCTLLEAQPGKTCNCDGAARQPPKDVHADIVVYAEQDPTFANGDWCYCEILQATGGNLTSCQSQIVEPVVNDTFHTAVDGWCYIDAARTPALGDPKLAAGCPQQRRLLRLVGDALPRPGAALFLDCR